MVEIHGFSIFHLVLSTDLTILFSSVEKLNPSRVVCYARGLSWSYTVNLLPTLHALYCETVVSL